MSKSLKTIYVFFSLLLKGVATQRRGNPPGSLAVHNPYYAAILLFLALPIGCSCLPDKSQVVGKEREWDKKKVELQKEMEKQAQSLHDGLKAIQQRYVDLDKKKLFQGDDVKFFLKDSYIPYLHAWKAQYEHLKKHEKNPSKKKDLAQGAQSASYYLKWVPRWIQTNDIDQLYELIKKLIDKN